MNQLLAALGYLKRGFNILPVEPRGKRPLIKWEEYQTKMVTSAEARQWWAANPCANVGVITGAISGLVVVDIDSIEAKNALVAMVGANQLAGVPKVETGRGWQAYFAHPGGVFANKTGIMPHIDIRGDGGYVVAPPSIHQNGRPYRWLVPLTEELPPLPRQIIDLANAPVIEPRGPGFDTKRALEGVPEGERDETIFKLASKLRGADVPEDAALSLVLEAAANCMPPFPEREAIEKVKRAYSRYAPREQFTSVVSSARQSSFWPELVSIESVIANDGPKTDWLWADTLPTGSASLLVAKPKVGKSNIAVNLSLAVARGLPFFGRATQQGKVGYIFLDGGTDEIVEVFAKFGVKKEDAISLHSGSVPERATDWLLEMAGRSNLRLVIIDTIQRFFRFSKIENYSEVTNAMEPLLDGMQRLGCHILFVHHAKKDAADVLDSAVGSTALRGLCYTFIHYRRLPNSEQRVIMTDQRAGKNMPEMCVQFDWKTGWLILNGTADDAEARDASTRIKELLDLAEGPMTESQIQSALGLRAISVSRALRDLFRDGAVERTGRGERGDAFKYSLARDLTNMALNVFRGRVIHGS